MTRDPSAFVREIDTVSKEIFGCEYYEVEVEPGVFQRKKVLKIKKIEGSVINSDTVIVFGDVKGNITNANNVVVIGGDIKGNITHADTVIRDTRTNLEKFLEDDDIVSKIKAEQNDSNGIRYEVR